MAKALVNGINIDYKVEGQGEPLIMISGLGSTKSNWRFQTGFFKKHFSTITFDNRGVGKSDKPDGPYTIKMMADDTIGLMGHLGIEKAHIFGWSMGGMIAQEIAINYPGHVDKLVLACTFSMRDETNGFSPEVCKVLEAYEKSSHNLGQIRRTADTLADLTFNKTLHRIINLLQQKIIIRLSSLYAVSGYVRGRVNGFSAQLNAILTHNTRDRLRKIRAPTLVITGTEDRIMKLSSSEVIANLIPHAKLVKVEGGSHGLIEEKHGEFNREVLDFLKK